MVGLFFWLNRFLSPFRAHIHGAIAFQERFFLSIGSILLCLFCFCITLLDETFIEDVHRCQWWGICCRREFREELTRVLNSHYWYLTFPCPFLLLYPDTNQLPWTKWPVNWSYASVFVSVFLMKKNALSLYILWNQWQEFLEVLKLFFFFLIVLLVLCAEIVIFHYEEGCSGSCFIWRSALCI